MSIEQLIYNVLSIVSWLIFGIVAIKTLRFLYFKELERLGKKNKQLEQENKDLKSSLNTLGSCVESGEDFYIYTSDGKKYLVNARVKE